ncbi:hypothetical protein MVEN_01106800 [Mycena venus]|uniref:Uncharacterized protein n=1 Tax=Mycena venus TaxID=2733690 RepID=A0A8H7D010_9AGAR|nr:hypothetical protein MVEN_01106800 [Mycena venus]
MTNSSSFCWYNPENEVQVVLILPHQVLLDVSFTVWKWVITSIFGILPLSLTLGSFAYYLVVRLCWKSADTMGYETWANSFLEKISWNRPSKLGISNEDYVEKPSIEDKEQEGAD